MNIVSGDICRARNATGHTFILIGCNAQGRMAHGVVGAVRARWPKIWNVYRSRYRKGIATGDYIVVDVEPNVSVVCLITQELYRGSVPKHMRRTYDFIDYEGTKRAIAGLADFILTEHDDPVEIHFPLIGGGLANGDVKRIVRIITDGLAGHDLTLWKFGR